MKSSVYIFLFLLVALFACQQANEKNTAIISKDSIPTFLDSLKFKFSNKQIFNNSYYLRDPDSSNGICKSPDTLTAIQKNAWNYEIKYFGTLKDLFYGATFYSKQHAVGSILPIVIEASSDDYNSLSLLCLNSNGKLISHLDIAGGEEGGPDSTFDADEDSVIVLTHEKFSSFVNDSVFNVNYVTYINNIHNRSYTIDSIASTYQIKRTGEISLLKKDSIRVLKKEIYDYK
ncbi:MAG: hypothetical protein JWP12_1714 [Bacteroidetes bacterium]|nr:hypothetical protein [Bacteroidota bacterium]